MVRLIKADLDCDFSKTSLAMGVAAYERETGHMPTTVVVSLVDAGFAYDVMSDGGACVRLRVVPVPGWAADAWMLCGPDVNFMFFSPGA